tara:strand:- start:21 stop:356 length:336 start_codon:yes stop_codon:yes gene_type:complete
VIAPIFEWSIHYTLHKINETFHKKHHIQYHTGKVPIEKWPIPIMLYYIYVKNYLFLFICFKYCLIHNIIHQYPNMLKTYTKHHFLHHKYPEYNYGVTSMWVDKLFGTEYKE